MRQLVVAKFGGGTLGNRGCNIPRIVQRIRELSDGRKVVAVFSAPTTEYGGKVSSLTDVAIKIGAAHAAAQSVDTDVFRQVYEEIAATHMPEVVRRDFQAFLDESLAKVALGLKEARDNRRFAGVTRARVLANTGEFVMANAMNFILRAAELRSAWLQPDVCPIVTDDAHDDALFLVEESRAARQPLLDLLEQNDIVVVAGFIGRSALGLETTFERGGSDRTAVDLAILLHDVYDVTVDFEKECAVFSADPSMDKRQLELVQHLSYREARNAALFGMKILDPLAIRELQEIGLDLKLTVTDLNAPTQVTEIRSSSREETTKNTPIKIVTGRQNCAIVRLESNAATHLVASLTGERRYFEFVQLSPYMQDEQQRARLLFLDADFATRNERYIRSYDRSAEVVRGRGAVTVVGDHISRIPTLASIVTGAIGARGIRITNIDFQEETSRLVLVVDDDGDNVRNAIRAVHGQRHVGLG
jgi:aspartate kinase